jgi:hypothetical protein
VLRGRARRIIPRWSRAGCKWKQVWVATTCFHQQYDENGWHINGVRSKFILKFSSQLTIKQPQILLEKIWTSSGWPKGWSTVDAARYVFHKKSRSLLCSSSHYLWDWDLLSLPDPNTLNWSITLRWWSTLGNRVTIWTFRAASACGAVQMGEAVLLKNPVSPY